MTLKTIHIIAVAFEKFGPLKVFVQSWLNQSKDNWMLTVIHDGPSLEFDFIMDQYQTESNGKLNFYSTKNRFNDWGHTLRDLGLQDIRGDYVLLTNADNYFIPLAIEILNEALDQEEPDVVLFNMIHSHENPGGRPLPSYSYFETHYSPLSIDISAAIVKTTLAKKAGFRARFNEADATYFEDVAQAKAPALLTIKKIPQVLFVHN